MNINVQNRELARLSGRAEMGFSHVSATIKSLETCVSPAGAGRNVRLLVHLQFPPQKQRPTNVPDKDLRKHQCDKDLAKITETSDG